MNKSDLPIGVMDSGLGGISVLRELNRIMPWENFIYYGDSANAPYGTKSHEEILKLTLNAAEYLNNKGIKALVVACNTATSVAINTLREMYTDIPVIGLEPALKPACEQTDDGAVMVMATPTTLAEEKFANLRAHYSNSREVISLPAPGLVEYIENGILKGAELEGFLKNLFAPYKSRKISAIVLGCTHYPFVAETIAKLMEGAVLFDGGVGAAKETKRRLGEMGLLKGTNTENGIDNIGNVTIENSAENDIHNFGNVAIENSLNDKKIIELSYRLLNS